MKQRNIIRSIALWVVAITVIAGVVDVYLRCNYFFIDLATGDIRYGNLFPTWVENQEPRRTAIVKMSTQSDRRGWEMLLTQSNLKRHVRRCAAQFEMCADLYDVNPELAQRAYDSLCQSIVDDGDRFHIDPAIRDEIGVVHRSETGRYEFSEEVNVR